MQHRMTARCAELFTDFNIIEINSPPFSELLFMISYATIQQSIAIPVTMITLTIEFNDYLSIHLNDIDLRK